MSADESPDPAQKHICDKCVKESYLRRLIQATGTRRTCSYCQNTLPTISIPALTDEVDKAFADHYEWTPCEPEGHEATLNLDPDCRWDWEREGDPAQVAIESAAGIASEPAEDIRNALEMRHATTDLINRRRRTRFLRAHTTPSSTRIRAISMPNGKSLRRN